MSSKLVFATALLSLPLASWANLIVNGDFAASSSEYVTPTGWTQIGLTQGVFPYASEPGMPAYDSSPNCYDFGGWANAVPNSGDGIEQTVATTAGTAYTFTFGLSSESGDDPPEVLNILINGVEATSYTVVSTSVPFTHPWATETFDFTAASASTTIAFTVTSSIPDSGNADLGNNDPLLAGVVLNAVSVSTPEPAGWSIAALGIGMVAFRRRLVRAPRG